MVLRFPLHLELQGLAAGNINQRLAAVMPLAYKGADSVVEPGAGGRNQWSQRSEIARLSSRQ